MTSVFIVRPFGKKSVVVPGKGKKDKSVVVDFDGIDKLLIQKAIAQNKLKAVTTGAIAEAGNIRLDMFQMLIAYDLVIADISIENAHVFYELGIRHGLRPKGTILLRFPTAGKDVPFDLKTDRYVAYDREAPGKAVAQLAQAIKETIAAMRAEERKPDSPVFLLLPELVPPDPAKLLVVPRDFQEAVEKARNAGANSGATLALLGEEAGHRPWAREGVRLVARAQRRNKIFKAARDSWEFIRKDVPNDVEANLQLATVYQRLGDLATSSLACRRVLENLSAARKDRADAYAQLARNEKAPWRDAFENFATEADRRRQALSDSRLRNAFQGYMNGFAEDLNDYYSGINAFSLLTAMVKLAEAEPQGWAGGFATAKQAEAGLDQYREQLQDLRGAVRISLDDARKLAERLNRPDEWLLPSEAQYRLLTAESADFVRSAYQAAREAGSKDFSIESEAAQVAIFFRLGLLIENCRAAFEALGVTPDYVVPAETPQRPRDRTLVGTGHRADAKGRKPPRFPNTPDCTAKAKAWLHQVIAKEQEQTEGSISGVAGAASGADLLFHEVCAELKIPTRVVLPIPVEDYRRESVADGGGEWIEKFNKLVAKNRPVMLSDSDSLPSW